MQAVCGWYDTRNTDLSPQDIMARMCQASPGSTHVGQIIPECGLAISVDPGQNALAFDNEVQLAIVGDPRWLNDKLQDIADRDGDAAALYHAYKEFNTRLFDFLNGEFSFVIVDHSTASLLFAIDRLGIHPMYYSVMPNGGVVFGSRADAATAHPNATADLNKQSIFHYLFFHMIPSPGTIYTKLDKLQPGSYGHYCNQQLVIQQYWHCDFKADYSISKSELSENLSQLFGRVIARNIEENDMGSFLSGGIDSSTIAGYLAKHKPSSANTYSIGFEAQGYDEMEYARITAKHFGTRHHEYYVTQKDVVDITPQIAAYYDEPFGNSSAVPTYYCAKFAAEHGAHLLLAGDGGDELFAGNERYAKQAVYRYYELLPAPVRKLLIDPVVYGIPGAQKIGVLRKARSYVDQAKVPLPDRLQTYNFLFRTPLEEILHTDFLAAINVKAPFDMMRETYSGVLSSSDLNKMLGLDWKFTLADNDLRKVRRMCEMAGMKVKFPFLDDELIAFSARVPPELKIRHGELRYFFKYAMRDFLPAEVIKKTKQGFGLPFGVWMKDHKPLQELAYDSLEALKKRHYLRADYIDRLRHQHQHEHAAYYGGFIWVLMMLEIWLQSRNYG